MTNRVLKCGLAVTALLLGTTSSSYAVLSWDFDVAADDGLTADGWTDTRGTSIGSGGGAFIPAGGRTASTNGGVAHNGQHPSLVFSSPLINIVGTGALSIDLTGGQGNGDSPTAAFPANLSDIPTDSTPTKGSNGWMLISLRRASDDDYVFHFQRPTQADQWVTYNIDLSAFADDGEDYYLDLIESFSGNWGHLSIDDVVIDATLAVPEPTSAILLLFAAAPLGRRFRRR